MDRLRIESWMREVRALWRRVLGIGSRGQVFYIGGSDVLPPPLEPCEDDAVFHDVRCQFWRRFPQDILD